MRQMVLAQLSPRFAHPAYHLSDMADDAAALLDHLGIAKAHVVGASMGGMIVQSMAIGHPDKVLSLTSIMSNTGDRKHGKVTFKLLRKMPRCSPAAARIPIAGGLEVGRLVGGPHFDEAEARQLIEADLARDPDREGAGRQTMAIAGSPDRTDALHRVTVPTLVIHGLVDPLVKPNGGIATAEAVPTAQAADVPRHGPRPADRRGGTRSSRRSPPTPARRRGPPGLAR